MDNRRLNTADFMAMGGLERPVPDTAEPEGREKVDYADVRDKLAETLDAGKIVSAYNYYGIPMVWRVSEGAYRGQLLQYRRVTEDEKFATVEEAVAWFEDMSNSTDG